MISKEEFQKIFLDKLDKIEKTEEEDLINIYYEIFKEQLQSYKAETELKEKTKKIKKIRKKKRKVNKQLEKKIVTLIVKYRKTSKEIKSIIKEENSIELSDRDLRKIKEDNFIKGNKIVEPIQQKINLDVKEQQQTKEEINQEKEQN